MTDTERKELLLFFCKEVLSSPFGTFNTSAPRHIATALKSLLTEREGMVGWVRYADAKEAVRVAILSWVDGIDDKKRPTFEEFITAFDKVLAAAPKQEGKMANERKESEEIDKRDARIMALQERINYLEGQLDETLNQIKDKDFLWKGISDTQRVELAKQAKIVEAAMRHFRDWNSLNFPGCACLVCQSVREADKEKTPCRES